MRKETLLFVLPLLMLSGCTGLILTEEIGLSGEINQEILRDGSSRIEIRYYGIVSALDLPTPTGPTSVGVGFEPAEIKASMKEAFSKGITEEEWQTMLLNAKSSSGLDPQDPRLAYPGPNPTDQQLQAIAEAFSEYVTAYYTEYMREMIKSSVCSMLTSMQGISLKSITCDVEGEDAVITGIYTPKNVSRYFEVDYMTFPYITYRYNIMGTFEMMTGNIPGISDIIQQIFSMQEAYSDLSRFGNISERQIEEMQQDITDELNAFHQALMEAIPEETAITYTLKMPGTITNTSVGALENNTLKTGFRTIFSDPSVFMGTSTSMVISQELNPNIPYLAAGIVLLGLLAFFVPRFLKRNRKKVKAFKKSVKKRKKAVLVGTGLICAAAVGYAMLPTINSMIKAAQLASIPKSTIDCNVSAVLNSKTGGRYSTGTFYCSDEGLIDPINVTYVISPATESYSYLDISSSAISGRFSIGSVVVEEGRLNGTVYFVTKS